MAADPLAAFPCRFAARVASLAKAKAPAGAAAVHTYVREETLVDPSVYEKEEHKWDPNGRDQRFPKTVSVPEGARLGSQQLEMTNKQSETIRSLVC